MNSPGSARHPVPRPARFAGGEATSLSPSVRRKAGQGMVEFALTLTVLLIMLAGVLDIGRALFTYIELRDAAIEGATYGTIAAWDSESAASITAKIEQRIRDAGVGMVNLADPAKTSVVISPTGSGWCSGSPKGVRVVVSTTFNLSTPLLGTVLGSQSFPLAAAAEGVLLRCP